MHDPFNTPWGGLEPITIVTDTPTPSLAAIVDRSAAFVVPAAQARSCGIIPVRWEAGALMVAASRPLSDAEWQNLTRIGPIRLRQAPAIDVTLAQWHLYGATADDHVPFGELAMRRHGLDNATLQAALNQQRRQGGRLGDTLVALRALTPWHVTEVLSEQTGIPTVNLLEAAQADATAPSLAQVWATLKEKDWRAYGMVPVRADESTIVVAITNPFDGHGRAILSAKSHMHVTAVLTGPRDIQARLDHQFQSRHLSLSQSRLRDMNPEDSATRTVTKPQVMALMGGLLVFLGFAVWHTLTTLAVVSSILVVAYAVLVGHRLWIIHQGTHAHNELQFSEAEVQALDPDNLPIYTILVPAREEATVLPVLTDALERLDYPKDRLDVKLLLEADDVATIQAARAAHLPSYMEIVVVPVAEPRTKPKACNYGLQRARGEFVTIYDAEDLPDPQQLKKALLAFLHGDHQLACVQAKLSYFNAEQNLLTRWFTAEYGAWFDLLLPALHTARLPIPLGGTSNHFRTQVLQDLGAWDPFNVTEDADLGIRLAKAGYRTAVMDSVTHEEANSEFVNWIRQRSRWIKGYLQTWLVHMRHPVQLHRQLGGRGFWGFQLAILGTPLMFILNPVYWFVTSLWFMTQWHLIPQLFPPGIYYLGMINLLVGNFAFTYLNAVGSAKRDKWNLVPYALLTPIYWSMMSLASWKALLQLFTRPSHWEKTEHGLVDWSRVQDEFRTPEAEASA